MRRFLILLPVLLAGLAQGQNLTTVTGTNITDQTGQTKLAAGRISFLATDAADKPIAFRMGGGGQVIKVPSSAAVTGGAIGTLTVPNPALTSPANIAYRVTVTDASGTEVLKYTGVQFTGSTFNFDTYIPPVGTIVVGVSVPNLTVGTLNVTTCTGCGLVNSVFGRVGTITAQANDYNFTQLAGSLAIGQTPLTTFGDLLYANSTPALARLGGNTTTTRMFLSQTGDGVNSAAPAWLALQAADIPDLSATYLKLTGGTLSGVTSFANGTAAAPGISFASSLGQGLANLANTTTCVMGGGGAVSWLCLPNTAGAGAQIPATSCYGISSSGTAGGASSDTKLCRQAAGILQIQATNGTTSGALMASQPVAAKTTNYTVTVLESGTIFHNTGAAGAVAFTLPASPTAGQTYTFVVTVAQNIVVTANTGQTIRNGASVSSSGGTATNGTIGSSITIVAITSTTWYVTETPIGTWTLA